MQANYCPYCLRIAPGDVCPHCGSNVHYTGDPMHLPVGTVLSGQHDYVLGAARGQGGFGITYIALDTVTGIRVAIKEYFPTHCSGRNNTTRVQPYYGQEAIYQQGREQFLQEAQMLHSLSDIPGIVNVQEYFEANNTGYLVMEFLDGCSLKNYVERNGKMPAPQFLRQLRPLLNDVDKMHRRGVIHRDIAPDNIILQPDGKMKLIDFGAARSFMGDKSMTVVVKKGFAPVEQYMRRGSNAATDVYALAATIWYCVTGIVPPDSADRQYGGEDLQSPVHFGAQMTPGQVRALEKALIIQPKDRTQSIPEFIAGMYAESLQPQTVLKKKFSFVQKDCPVRAISLELIYNPGTDVFSVKTGFRNLTARPIAKVRVEFLCKNKQGKPLGRGSVALIACSGKGAGQEFGQEQAVNLTGSDIADVLPAIREVFFNDGSCIRCPEEVAKLPEPRKLETVLNKELLQEYKRQSKTKRPEFVPVLGDGCWRCCCGEVNFSRNTGCFACGASRDGQIAALDIKNLQQLVAQRQAEEERQRRIREEERKKKLAKLKKVALTASAVAVLAIVVFSGVKIGVGAVQKSRYETACQMLQESRYMEAYDLFASLGDYENSAYNASDALYLHGVKLQSEGKYQEALDIFKKNPHFRDSRSKMEFCENSLTYDEGVARLEKGEYDVAYEIFMSIRTFSDSERKARQAMQQKGEKMMEQGEYEKATEAFALSGDAQKEDYCRKYPRYTYALSCLQAKKYEEAANIFLSLENFQDSREKADEAGYIWGKELYDSKKYEEAYDIFSALSSGYKDAATLAKESLYHHAEIREGNGDLHAAYKAWSKISSYKDSKNRANAAEYAYGMACLEQGKYESAITAFKNISGYQNSKTMMQDAKYQQAGVLLERGDYSGAEKLYKELSGYRDSAKQLQKVSYEVGCDQLKNKKYISAVQTFEELGNYSDSKTKVKEAKYAYASNASKDDWTGYLYLEDLKKANYKDSKKLYDSRYAWKATLVAVNSNEGDRTTRVSSVSHWDKNIHFIFELSGGPPSKPTFGLITTPFSTDNKPKVDLYHKVFWPGGGSRKMDWYWEQKSAGDDLWLGWTDCIYRDPNRAPDGYLTIKIYVKGTNECIGEGSVYIS